jgi:hypothetical protein
VDDYDVVDLLTGVADRCVSLLGVSAAGVMLASPAGSLDWATAWLRMTPRRLFSFAELAWPGVAGSS